MRHTRVSRSLAWAYFVGSGLTAACMFQPISVTVPPCYPHCVEGCVPTGAEVCGDGLDQNCDGLYDEGCSCAAGATQACGASAGACVAGQQTCDGGTWGVCVGVVGPSPETCGDSVDNDCDGDTDEDCPCALGTKQPCGEAAVGDCLPGEQFCLEGSWGPCVGGVSPRPETCDDHDNNCNTQTDEGCDDDNDGFCDATMTLVGTPAACPRSTAPSLTDCDDGDPAVNPGAGETCTDDIDNDCDSLTDFADRLACPEIGIRIVDPPGPRAIGHGQTLGLRAELNVPLPAASWPRTWSVVAADGPGGCSTADVTFAGNADSATSSTRNATFPDAAAKMDCTYTIEARVHDYASATVAITVVNRAPRVSSVAGASLRDGQWVLDVWGGAGDAIVSLVLADEDDQTLTVGLRDSGGQPLDCSGACPDPTTSSSLPYAGAAAFTWPNAGGDEETLTAVVTDSLGASTTAPIRIRARTCVWVRGGGTGAAGTDPGSDAFGSIGAAVGYIAAQATSDAAVCIAGADNFVEYVDLDTTAEPDLLGGFDAAGAVDLTYKPTLMQTGVPLTLRDHYQGTIRSLTIIGSGDPTVVEIVDASPRLEACVIRATVAGSIAGTGIRITGENSLAAPVLRRSDVSRGTSAPVDQFTAVVVDGRGLGSATAWLLDNELIDASDCDTLCRAVWVQSAEAIIEGNHTLHASAVRGAAVVIDLAGDAAKPARGRIVGNTTIAVTALYLGPTHTAAIRMNATDGVTISGNDQIGGFDAWVGSAFAAAIVDGDWDEFGHPTPGASTNLTISSNRVIMPGRYVDFDGPCSGTIPGRGPTVAAGILLVGTLGATIADNGRVGDAESGIWGGVSTTHWDANNDSIPPSAVGVWTLDTDGVDVVHNEIRGGVLVTRGICQLPDQADTPVVAFRDGTPPATASTPSRASTGLWLDGNGIVCTNALGAAAAPLKRGGTPCVGVELNAPRSGGNESVLTNNYVAATFGPEVRALSQRGGGGVAAANNTFDVDFVSPTGAATFTGARRYAVVAERIEDDGLALLNSILLARSAADDSERFAIYEVSGATGSQLRMLKNCLLWVEPALIGHTTTTGYLALLADGLPPVIYDQTQLNGIPSMDYCEANLADPPGWLEAATPEAKSRIRLSPYLPAVDRGHLPWEAIPLKDIDGDSRETDAGSTPDIGHDELVQPAP